MVKNILVLPGTRWQLELVNKIKEMGHKVLIANPDSNCSCAEVCDGFLHTDIFNIAKIIDYCKENNVDAVISDECDIAIPVIARVGEACNLNAIDIKMAELFTNKYKMREFCCNNGLKSPEYKLCRNVDEAIEFYNEINKSIILKPIDCNASKGVYKVESEADIRENFDKSMGFSRWQKYVLAERYIDGIEFTIDGIKTPNAHYTLAISEKKHYKHNANIASELLFTHCNDKYDYEKLIEVNDAFVNNSELKYGLTHAEYKYEDGEYYLIEIAARGGGNMISSVISRFMSGHDVYKYLVNCSLGDVTDFDFSLEDECKDRAAILKFFETPLCGGIVEEIQGLDVLEEEKDVVEYMLNFNIGDRIENAISDSARIGFYIVCSENVDKLNRTVAKIENSFKIVLKE